MHLRGWVIVGGLFVLAGCTAATGEPGFEEQGTIESEGLVPGLASERSSPVLDGSGAVSSQVLAACVAPDPSTLERRAPTTCVPECRWMCTGDLCDVPEQLTIGRAHSCSVRTSGGVECWGTNDRGQLGQVASIARSGAITIAGLTCVDSIDAGDDHTCALIADGSVVCWGANDAGQLGDGTRIDRAQPVRVALLEPAVEVAVGGRTSCAREADGGVVCWGASIGGGDVMPVEVAGLTDAIDLDVGGAHACAALASGEVACWGANANGQLGDGTTVARASALVVPALSGMTGVRTGGAHTCAMDALKHAICWGANASGQLGDGTTIDRLRPTVEHPSVIAMGGDRTCGRFSFGQVGCWGEGYGSEPALIAHLVEASGIAIGEAHGCAAHVVGAPRCWGDNDQGQLGDGTLVAAPVVPVDTLPPARAD